MKTRHFFKTKQRGYILLMLMLLLGSLSLYLTLQFSIKKAKAQSWQVQKTATEMGYWLDVEYNYILDHPTNDQNQLNNIQLIDIVQNNHYLPYGQPRPVTFPSPAVIIPGGATSTTISQVSEFLCSSLPGINHDDYPLTNTTTYNATCAIPVTSGYPLVHCTLDTPAYYACGDTMNAPATQYTSRAQYYVNANNISLGNYSSVGAAVGLIVRTPGTANPYVTSGTGPNSVSLATLPNNSAAQMLIPLLPSGAFNVYPTNNTNSVDGTSNVNGIGIAATIFQSIPHLPIRANTSYSKIIDMGTVQAVDLSQPLQCHGWSGDTKVGTGINGSNKNDPNEPPTCIQINTQEYGPSGTIEKCDRIDVLYTMQNVFQQNNNYWYLDLTKMKSQFSADHVYKQIFLSIYSSGASDYLTSRSNGNKLNNAKNYLTYFVRCTRKNIVGG